MDKVRSVIAALILAGLCSFGLFVLAAALLVLAMFSGESGLLVELVELLGMFVVVGALLLVSLSGLALWLRPRRRLASDVLATLLGLLVVAATAGGAEEYGFALVSVLVGLLLVLTAFPLPSQPRGPDDGPLVGSYR